MTLGLLGQLAVQDLEDLLVIWEPCNAVLRE
jgi:hypothetical protein